MWFSGGFGLAAAAAVVLAIGVVVRPFERTSPASYASAYLLDPTLASSMIDMHDKCCKNGGKHQIDGAPGDQVITTGEVLEQRLGRPVLAASMPEGGWTFRGGAIFPVAPKPAAHLIFKNATDSVSVFSMPRNVSPSTRNQTGYYEAEVGNHAIAGFVDSRGVYCLVGSGSASITPERLAAIRDRIEGSVVRAPQMPQRSTVVQAELLQTVP